MKGRRRSHRAQVLPKSVEQKKQARLMRDCITWLEKSQCATYEWIALLSESQRKTLFRRLRNRGWFVIPEPRHGYNTTRLTKDYAQAQQSVATQMLTDLLMAKVGISSAAKRFEEAGLSEVQIKIHVDGGDVVGTPADVYAALLDRAKEASE